MLPVFVFLGLIGIAWYLLIARPQRSQQHEHASLLGQLGVGDHVMTVGGLYGQVVAVDAGTVQLQLAPGVLTRVATAGIARLVPAQPVQTGHTQQQPSVGTVPNDHQGQHTMTQQHQPQHPHPHMPQVQPAPYAQPTGYTPPAPIYAAPAPAYAAPAPTHTFRAQVQHAAPGPEPTFVVRNPLNLPPPLAAAHGHHAPQGPPVHQQYAAPVVPQHQATPQFQYAPAVATQPYAQPTHAAVPQPAAPVVDDPRSRRSRAPEGMGQAERVTGDVQQTLERARSEREELADEYRRLTAPLVQHEPVQPVAAHVGAPVQMGIQPAPPLPAPGQLFVHQPSAGAVAAPAAQYPGPVRVAAVQPVAAGVPRPQMAPAPTGPDLPAAFQRRASYSPSSTPVSGGFNRVEQAFDGRVAAQVPAVAGS